MTDTANAAVRTRTLNDRGAWVEADDPAQRLPKARRFILTAPVPPGRPAGGIIAEGVVFGDGAVVVRFGGDNTSTVIYNIIEDVIASTGDITWID